MTSFSSSFLSLSPLLLVLHSEWARQAATQARVRAHTNGIYRLVQVIMVDLDKVVVDVSREQLPEWNAGSTEDPRLKLFYTDAYKWLDRDDGRVCVCHV